MKRGVNVVLRVDEAGFPNVGVWNGARLVPGELSIRTS